MHVIIGAGQIGRELAAQLTAQGQRVTVVRQRDIPIEGAHVIAGDARDEALIRGSLRGAHVVYYAMHAASYTPRAWRRILPLTQAIIMDAAAREGSTVVFPESVYAFGHQATALMEGAPLAPSTPLGHVSAELIDARAKHPARTINVIAADLVGRYASPHVSFPTMFVVDPLLRGKQPFIIGEPSLPHAVTDIADIARAMIYVGAAADRFAGQSLHAPTAAARSPQEFSNDIARFLQRPPARMRRLPRSAVRIAGTLHPTVRSVAHMSYLWYKPHRLLPGILQDELGEPRWSSVVAHAASIARPCGK